ncbi:NAD(P)/FAD-dependent oxidoreductase [Bacillus sp. FJAT-45350]|uniref:NAD(P)/FAD-dependent oxidoreductase n=1 Tax=Bacillus sp. FJAT-45350 TaxID=2011014 RepID=UPI000BB842A6|nr:NAD(P)/FAD-dependent oxidoreductase [Bacillus sp. FJAT-45350]
MIYDCIIVGGGIAGLQAAIQLGRYKHSVAVIDSNKGRSSLCKEYHNILGWPDGISGDYFRQSGKIHAERYGVKFIDSKALKVKKNKELFSITVANNDSPMLSKRILFATGITDSLPELPGLLPCLGNSIYLCPDCDGYEVKDKRTIVLGSGEKGANLSLIIHYWTKEIIYVNHTLDTISEDTLQRLENYNIQVIEEPIAALKTDGKSQFHGVTLKNGQTINAKHSFIAFSGTKVNSDLAKSLGVERLENKHIVVDPRTKMTNVPNVWAVGDATVHSQLLTIAMGDGAQAAIWIHKSLLSS